MTQRAQRSRNRRTETVAFRVSTEERDRLEDGAIEAGMTLSAYLAALLDKRVTSLRARLAETRDPDRSTKPLHRTLPPEVMQQLSRIGNNINQIAHAINSGLPPEPRHMLLQLQSLMQLIYANNLHQSETAPRSDKAANDGSPSSQTRQEFQRRVHVRPARPWDSDDR